MSVRKETLRAVTLRRMLTISSVPVVVALTALLLPVVLAGRLPERAFTEGVHPYSQPWSALMLFPPLWIAVLTTVLIALLVVRGSDGVWARGSVAAAWGGAVGFGGMSLPVIASNLDVVAPPAHAVPWWAGPWATALVGVVAAALGWLAAGPDGDPPVATRRPGPDAPRIPLGRDERVLWSRSVFSRRMLVLTGALLVAAALLVLAGLSEQTPVSVVLVLVVTAATVAQVWVRVRVDGAGVHVVQPLLGRTLVGAALEGIVEASAVTAGPQDFPTSGYGLVHRAGLIGYRAVRIGPALRLELTDGRLCLVTVPDAGTAAALLNAELDRGREPAC